jgi:magnesium transporter
MDVDMAMQLSRARRDTVLSSPVALTAIPSQQADHTFSPSIIPEEDTIPDFEQIEVNDDLAQPSLSIEPHPQNNTEDVTASNFGLPTYQANGSLSHFDFTRMEEFATAEKASLGLNTPINARLFLRGRPKSAPMVPAEEVALPDQTPQTEDGPSSGQLPLRQRKLSQSNPYPRSHRKGIGGKMALFENTSNNAPSFPSRLDLPFPAPVSDIPPNPSYDFISGIPAPIPSNGILNSGHDRPYRFSFYSNALSATIHARSLSELPADGQSFEQLFSGTPSQQPSTSPRPTFSPPYQEPNNRFSNPDFFNNNNNNNNNHIGSNGIGNRRGFIEKPNGTKGMHDMNMLNAEQDLNTWWLDVQSPTDEEMKMLSKVFSIHPLTTEDILMEETREKIELFRNYYLVCFRSFDQDPYSPTHLEPLNMYIIVFREGILSVCLLRFFF